MHNLEIKRFTFLVWRSKCLFISGILVKLGRTHLKLALAKEEGLWSRGLSSAIGSGGVQVMPWESFSAAVFLHWAFLHHLSSQEDPSCAQEQKRPQVGPGFPSTNQDIRGGREVLSSRSSGSPREDSQGPVLP